MNSARRLLAEDLVAFAPWPKRASRTALQQRSGGPIWEQYVESVAALLPPHTARSHYDSAWRWTTPAGIWNLQLTHPHRSDTVGRVKVWMGHAWDDSAARWALADPTITHVIGFLVVVGALDWERPREDEEPTPGDPDA